MCFALTNRIGFIFILTSYVDGRFLAAVGGQDMLAEGERGYYAQLLVIFDWESSGVPIFSAVAGLCAWVYVCMYVCMYACLYVCMI
jgi:hypothetical protein